jgi:hypothetical protein
VRTIKQIQADADSTAAPFSNGTEFEMWADTNCYECINDTMGVASPDPEVFCPILSAALLGGWPKEWLRRDLTWTDKDGVEHSYKVVDTCTEFEERRDGRGGNDTPKPSPPPAECDGQLDIIDAYVDTAIAELTPKPVEAVAS